MPSGAFYRTSYGRTGTMLSLPTSNQRSSFSWFRIPLPASTEVAPGAVCWGSAGEMPTPEPMPSVGFNVKSTHTEISREEDPVRITNPDDSSQYIMVNRASSILFNVLNDIPDKNKNTYAAPVHDVNPKMLPVAGQQTGGQLRMNLKNGPNSL